MFRLQLLNLSSRETHRLSAKEVNRKLGCGGLIGPPLPLEINPVPQVPSGRFVVYYGSDLHGKLPPHHNDPSVSSRPTIFLVKVEGCKEDIIDEGMVISNLQFGDTNTSYPWVYMMVQCEKLGLYAFHCSGISLV